MSQDAISTSMSGTELRTAFSLSGVYALRMLGLFMILPVFALYTDELEGATPVLAGLAIGIYGMTQALLQIPFGLAFAAVNMFIGIPGRAKLNSDSRIMIVNPIF